MNRLSSDQTADINDFLGACIEQYDELRDTALTLRMHGSPELLLDWLQMMANFAAMHHPGRFFDGWLENMALEIGRSLSTETASPLPKKHKAIPTINRDSDKRRVTHVATTISSIGGHTQTILNWIRNDTRSEHSLITTDSIGVNIPLALSEAIHASGGRIVTLANTSAITERALQLRRWAQENADIVFLHIVPHDIVPVAAFACDEAPPIALINLADQCFWLGSTVADSIVHLRNIGVSSSQEIRHTRNDLLLPIPLHETHVGLGKKDARELLNIPDTQLMLLSVGRGIKYAPSRNQNFFRTACRLLDRNPDAHLYVVGVSQSDYSNRDDFYSHDRMHLLGPLDDATVHQRAADLYIEGFPFGSQTALLESVMPGTPCVPAIAPATQLLATQDIALDGLVDNPCDEDAYVSRASALINDSAFRESLGLKLREQVLNYHVGSSWVEILESVYDALSRMEHSPQTIPETQGQMRIWDVAISQYHGTRFTATNYKQLVTRESVEMNRMSAYFMRERGFYLNSFRLLCCASKIDRWDRDSMSYVVKLLPHKIYSFCKRKYRSNPESYSAPGKTV